MGGVLRYFVLVWCLKKLPEGFISFAWWTVCFFFGRGCGGMGLRGGGYCLVFLFIVRSFFGDE